MGSALLSRFDLVFILVDKPDKEMDAMLSDHVMALHAGRGKKHKLTNNAAQPEVQYKLFSLSVCS